MNPLRSVGARLGLGLAVVVAAALVLVDLIVVPSLERNLINAKLTQLEEAAPTVGSSLLLSPSYALDDAIQAAQVSSDARVVYFRPLTYNPPKLLVNGDSSPVTSADVENDPFALSAFAQARSARGTVTTHGVRYAEAAYPLIDGSVVLLRAPLHDSLRSIHLVRSRLVVAGLIALAASLLVGYAAASVFARRIRRLERAADRIASGDFSEPVVDSGRDELGQLAAAFERMRLRLAQLEHARREFIANASHELRTPLFSLGGFLELAVGCDLFITNDTGTMHVAAAAGVPVLALFGSTDEQATAPLGPHVQVLKRPVECSPCLLRHCPVVHRCMREISVREVFELSCQFLDSVRPSSSTVTVH